MYSILFYSLQAIASGKGALSPIPPKEPLDMYESGEREISTRFADFEKKEV